MSKKEKNEEVVSTPEVETKETVVQIAYRAMIARYAKQNPVKYAAKKEALEAKVNDPKACEAFRIANPHLFK